MTDSSCLILWGSRCSPPNQEMRCRCNKKGYYSACLQGSVVDCLFRFKLRGAFRPTIQSLQVLAYEAAMLAGHEVDEEYERLAKERLIPLSSILTCTALDDEGGQCHCVFCINKALYGDADVETAWYNEENGQETFDMAMCMHDALTIGTLQGTLFTTTLEQQSNESLQKNFMVSLLGEGLASKVKLRFGTIRTNMDWDHRVMPTTHVLVSCRSSPHGVLVSRREDCPSSWRNSGCSQS